MRRFAFPLATLLLSACAIPVPTSSSAPAPDRVDFSTSACFGSCPVFDLSLSADGAGVYEGEAYVKERGRHSFAASPAEVAAFFDRIAPFRPVDGNATFDFEHCSGPVATDNPTVTVTWHEGSESETLTWYLGCREEGLMDIKPDLYGAWKELPLENLVGPDGNRFQYGRPGEKGVQE